MQKLDCSILYVDSDTKNINIVKNFLPYVVKEIIIAKDGLEGIKKARENNIDIIIAYEHIEKLNAFEMVKTFSPYVGASGILALTR